MPANTVHPTRLYQSSLENQLNGWEDLADVDEKWKYFRDSVLESAASSLGYARRRRCDWYRESMPTLQSLIDKRNLCYEEWLSLGQERDSPSYSAFKAARAQARVGVVEARSR